MSEETLLSHAKSTSRREVAARVKSCMRSTISRSDKIYKNGIGKNYNQ